MAVLTWLTEYGVCVALPESLDFSVIRIICGLPLFAVAVAVPGDGVLHLRHGVQGHPFRARAVEAELRAPGGVIPRGRRQGCLHTLRARARLRPGCHSCRNRRALFACLVLGQGISVLGDLTRIVPKWLRHLIV